VFDGTLDLDGAFDTDGDLPVDTQQLLLGEPPPVILSDSTFLVVGGL
jgi:hypothetical protein